MAHQEEGPGDLECEQWPSVQRWHRKAACKSADSKREGCTVDGKHVDGEGAGERCARQGEVEE